MNLECEQIKQDYPRNFIEKVFISNIYYKKNIYKPFDLLKPISCIEPKYNDLIKYIEDEGGQYIDIYKQLNKRQRYYGANIIEYYCKNNHNNKQPFSYVYNKFCIVCNVVTINDAHKLAKSIGWKFLSTEFKGLGNWYLWKCNNGHKITNKYTLVLKGYRCKICVIHNKYEICNIDDVIDNYSENLITKMFIPSIRSVRYIPIYKSINDTIYIYELSIIENIRIMIEKIGGTLIKIYPNLNTFGRWFIDYICVNGHNNITYDITLINHHKKLDSIIDKTLVKSICIGCTRKRILIKHSLESLQQIAEEKKGKCLSVKFRTIDDKYEFQCANGHIWTACGSDMTRGSWCDQCNSNIYERTCKKIMEYIYKEPFNKERPDWLLSNIGGRLELDVYNSNLKLALEYSGIQHYKYIDYFDKSEDDFNKRIIADKIKVDTCKKRKVHLIIVPYTVKYEDLYTYIKDRCINVPDNLPDKIDYNILDLSDTNTEKFEEITQFIKEKYGGGEILSKIYVNNFTHIEFRCKDGHEFQQKWSNVMFGHFCSQCHKQKVRDDMMVQIDAYCKKINFIRLDPYINAKEWMNFKCNKGTCTYVKRSSWDVFSRGITHLC